MEFLYEIIFEVILGGSIEAGTKKSVPWLLRIVSLLVLVIVYGGLLLLCGYAVYQLAREGNLLGAMSLGLLFVVVMGLLILGLVKKYKKNH